MFRSGNLWKDIRPVDKIQVILGTLGILLGVVSLSITVFVLVRDITEVKEQISFSLFRIAIPESGSIVTRNTTVIGTSPYRTVKHYVLVTPVLTKVDYVSSNPESVSSGKFQLTATIGDGASCGEMFELAVLATNETLEQGLLEKRPDDEVTSVPVLVSREPCN